MCETYLGGFIGHLDAILQDRHREVGGGVGCEPESEAGVGGVRGQGGTQALQGGHPADCQVAVLQHHPAPL